MSSRPGTYINWTDGSPTKVVQPPAGQLLSGWVADQKAPFRFMNWLFYILDQWIQYFDGAVSIEQISTTTAITATSPTRTVLADPSGGFFGVTIDLAANLPAGYRITVINIALSSGNVVNVTRSGSDLLHGEVAIVLAAGEGVTLEGDGVSRFWQVQ